MKIHMLVFTTFAMFSAAAFAADSATNHPPVGLKDMVAHMESTYRGQVTGIQYDSSGDKPAHYHVDMSFPQNVQAKLDVDAVTREISARQARALPAGFATLPEIVTVVSALIPGELLVAELDAGGEVAPHYDVDVRLSEGKIGRLKVDAATRSIGWRQPALIDE